MYQTSSTNLRQSFLNHPSLREARVGFVHLGRKERSGQIIHLEAGGKEHRTPYPFARRKKKQDSLSVWEGKGGGIAGQVAHL